MPAAGHLRPVEPVLLEINLPSLSLPTFPPGTNAFSQATLQATNSYLFPHFAKSLCFFAPQLMLATGSADTTVRVWDVAEEVLPHADEWARVKKECFLGGSNERILEQKAALEKAFRPNQGSSSVSADIVALENALMVGQDDEDDDPNDRNHYSSTSPGTKNSVAASATGRIPQQTASATRSSAAATAVTVSKENARCTLRSLRPEILRQAGARPVWRTGRVTAVLDRSVCPLNHASAAMGSTPLRGKKSKSDPLIEVRVVGRLKWESASSSAVH